MLKNNNLKNLKKIAGILLIIAGIFGLFLPLLQGVLMISTGIILLGNKYLITKFKKVKAYLRDFFSS